ncbi:MAG: SDR family oxidoreductase [Anaerolineae bacterium]|nr:SDR family oxidoreductase [Anaerolineae bacterium]MDW8067464.1 SDR family oxidoreductase [Anaerolineae bacterium]
MPHRCPEEIVVLITGATSGIGKACADHLARRGYRVFGTGRRAPFPPDPAPPGHPVLIQMDVTQDDSVQRAVDFVVRETGRLDGVVNNAGFGIAGAVEDTSIEEAKAQLETNFFGVLRVCRAALPVMRAQGEGLIVNIGSLGGVIALPFQALYSASKFAVAGLTEALRLEVRPFGIRVALIEPGDIRTGFTDHRVRVAAWTPDSVYRPWAERALRVMEADERNGAPPEVVAFLLERILRSSHPAPHYRVGPAFQRLAAVLKGILPARFFEWALAKYYRLL